MMSLNGPLTVTDAKGERGTIDRRVTPLESAAGASVTVRLENGREVSLPARSLAERSDGEFHVLSNFDDLAPNKNGDDLNNRVGAGDGGDGAERVSAADAVVPVVEEHLRVGRREVEAGRVRFTKRVLADEVLVDEPFVREEVEVVRVAVGRQVEAPPPAREVDGTLIIPVLEEVLVIEKRLVLVEELHVRKRRVEERRPQSFTLRKEEVVAERLDAPDGRARPAADGYEPGNVPEAEAPALNNQSS
jgi:uncharacterized protein (TIGR02271 family)